MLDHIKDAFDKQVKRLSRHGDHESFAEPAGSKLTGEMDGPQNSGQSTSITQSSLHIAGPNLWKSDDGIESVPEHPAVHPLATRLVPRSPIHPRQSLTPPTTPPRKSSKGQGFKPGGTAAHHEHSQGDLPSVESSHGTCAEDCTNDIDQNGAGRTTLNFDPTYDRVKKHADVYFDHAVHDEAAVTHEEIRPSVHTIYQPQRTRSFHFHEHRTVIQPIIDPNPTILPEEHWAEDYKTGEMFKIPGELGSKLDETFGREDK